jgi:hypothetical protein
MDNAERSDAEVDAIMASYFEPRTAKGEIRTFESGATRDTAAGKPNYRRFLSMLVLRRYGEYMMKHQVQPDGALREPDNWKKGIPQDSYLDSGFRHFVDLCESHEQWAGTDYRNTESGHLALRNDEQKLEDLACAIMFNAMGYLHERLVARGY